MRQIVLLVVAIAGLTPAHAQKVKTYKLSSPDNKLHVSINASEAMSWSII